MYKTQDHGEGLRLPNVANFTGRENYLIECAFLPKLSLKLVYSSTAKPGATTYHSVYPVPVTTLSLHPVLRVQIW